MINFLTAYLLHSTALLATMWLTMRIARPRSPVLIECLWKLAAVLPVMTALAMMCWPAVNHSDVRPTSNHNDVLERLDDVTVNEPPQDMAVSADTISDDNPSVAQFTEPWTSNGQPLEELLANDPAVDRFPNSIVTDRRMGTPARPHDNLPTPDETGNPPKADQPTVVLNISPDLASSEPNSTETAKAQEFVIAEPTIVAETDALAPPERAESWWRPAWQVASALLPFWAVIGAAWLLIRSAWFRWRLRNARRVTQGRAVDLLCELRSHARQSVGEICARDSTWTRTAHGLATVVTQTIRLRIVPGFAEPAAFGVFRPTIVLPPSCESLDREALRAVLAHELGHIARGDLWWLAVGRVLTTVFGFQPLNRIARREWTRAAECLCDDWAVGRGVERLTLARCLTALAEHRLTGVSLADALAAVGSPSSLRQRIERLVAEPVVDPWSQQSRRWLVSGSVLAVGVFVAVMLPLPDVLSARPLESVSSATGESGNRQDVDDTQTEPLSEDIETELFALRTELQHAARLAEQRHEPFWIDAAESLRERERQIVERWRRWQIEKDMKQETSEGEH